MSFNLGVISYDIGKGYPLTCTIFIMHIAQLTASSIFMPQNKKRHRKLHLYNASLLKSLLEAALNSLCSPYNSFATHR